MAVSGRSRLAVSCLDRGPLDLQLVDIRPPEVLGQPSRSLPATCRVAPYTREGGAGRLVASLFIRCNGEAGNLYAAVRNGGRSAFYD
jgi:hypothetical protein